MPIVAKFGKGKAFRRAGRARDRMFLLRGAVCAAHKTIL
jgi:hypothetical protein